MIKSTLSNFQLEWLTASRKFSEISCGGRIGDEFKFRLVNWFKICTPLSLRRFGSEELDSVIKLSWGNAFGSTPQRGRLCGIREHMGWVMLQCGVWVLRFGVWDFFFFFWGGG